MDNAIAGLIGVGVGAGLTLWNEKLKWDRQRKADDLKWVREGQVRYNADRVEAYATFLRLGKALATANWEAPDPPDTTELTIAYYRVELLASPRVRAAAHEYNGQLIAPALAKKLNYQNQGPKSQAIIDAFWPDSIPDVERWGQPADPEKWAKMLEQAKREPILVDGKPSIHTVLKTLHAEQVFMEAVREELGVAPPAQVIPETGKPTGPRWRPFRRKPRKNSAALENAASSENEGP